MSGFSSLRERAQALRDGIEELLLDEGAKVALDPLKQAETSISKFCEVGATEAGVASLDTTKIALERAKTKLTDASALSLVEEAIQWSIELRARSLDEIGTETPAASFSFGFRASKGSPVVHEAGDVASIEVLARAKKWDEIGAEEDEDPEPTSALADPQYVGLRRLARDTMEDIAILGGLRKLGNDERWGDARGFEERLLANLDLLWSFDAPAHEDVPKLGVPRALFDYAAEWSQPDWGRVFALSFALGCTRSEAALRWVTLAMRRSSSTVMSAFVHGLAIASGPHVDKTILAELHADAPEPIIVTLLEVAERRGLFEASAVVPFLAYPSAAVRIAALRALRAGPRDLGTASALRLLEDRNPHVAIAAADELARRGHSAGLEHLKPILTSDRSLEDRTIALRALVLAGSSKDEAVIVETAKSRTDGSMWLGFFGRPSVVPIILDELKKAREAGAARAFDAVIAERAFTRITGLQAHADANKLQIQFEQSGLAKKATRLRRGEPWDAKPVVAGLLDLNARQGERRIVARELPLVLPNAPPFDIDGFIATQLGTISAL